VRAAAHSARASGLLAHALDPEQAGCGWLPKPDIPGLRGQRLSATLLAVPALSALSRDRKTLLYHPRQGVPETERCRCSIPAASGPRRRAYDPMGSTTPLEGLWLLLDAYVLSSCWMTGRTSARARTWLSCEACRR
jgi:hypothetical protein